ncbi:hypothetical protein TNCT_697401 [Trichonephila clavata]|uniref:Uncharacterized protein n=1 Tax=Trichonephila clavata TaxID=2740835 RepID=A0A8X6HZB2_TRICU|nr:hypothetical protein TNCT_697401 [Trichonephila clavata]
MLCASSKSQRKYCFLDVTTLKSKGSTSNRFPRGGLIVYWTPVGTPHEVILSQTRGLNSIHQISVDFESRKILIRWHHDSNLDST